MSNEEEYDYMSVNFLAEGASHDVRPGLQSRTEKRQSEIIKKKEISDMMNKKSNISMKKMEMKNLQLGLHMPISSSNKGFAMLEKMGFKPGTSLGKTGDGITEPIPVSINRNFREGLGVKAALEEMRQAKKQMRKEAKLNKQSFENFRSRVSEEVSGREAGIDLYKSQKTCFSLDTAEVRTCMANSGLPASTESEPVFQHLTERLKGTRTTNGSQSIRKKGNLNVAVVPIGYPNCLLKREQFEEMENTIKSIINQIKSGNYSPKFESMIYDDKIEACMIKCLNPEAKSWLCSNLFRIILTGDIKVRHLDPDDANRMFSKRFTSSNTDNSVKAVEFHKIGMLLNGGPPKKKKFLHRISIQNPELDVSSWFDVELLAKQKSFVVLASIPESDLKTLRNMDFRLYYGLTREQVFEVTDEITLRTCMYSKELDVKNYDVDYPYSLSITVDNEIGDENPCNFSKWFLALAQTIKLSPDKLDSLSQPKEAIATANSGAIVI